MESIKEIREKMLAAPMDALADLLEDYEGDQRAGVQRLVQDMKKKLDALAAEEERLGKMREYENRYQGEYACICGIDEAGRGPLAGPVVAAAVVLPKDALIWYANDSKKLSEKKREELYQEICARAVTYGIGMADAARIDEINILQATYEAMRQAVAALDPQPDLLLNDAVTIPGLPMRQVPIIKGDAKSLSIACASILAKVTRDRMMKEMDEKYPGYGFARHKGYGCREHIETIKKLGPCPIHRRSFIKNFWQEE